MDRDKNQVISTTLGRHSFRRFHPERMDARVKLCPTAGMQETVLPDDSGIFLEQKIIFPVS
jgi:hypothetical protein